MKSYRRPHSTKLKNIFSAYPRTTVLSIAIFALALIATALTAGPAAQAANPTSGSLGTSSTSLTWQGTSPGGATPNDPVVFKNEDLCQEGINCETFTLTISGTPADWATAKKLVHVNLNWTLPAYDYDLYIHKGSLSGDVVASSGNGATSGVLIGEDADLDPSNPGIGTGVFAVHVVYWNANAADEYKATASVTNAPVPTPTPTPSPGATPPPASTEIAPRFSNFPDPYNDEGGEPSIGVNWKSGNAMYISSLATLRIGFDDATSPARASWADKSFLSTSTISLDPILYTNSRSGRTFVSQLLSGLGYGMGCSSTAFSDDDGESWLQSEGCGLPTSGADHQSLGGGPFGSPLNGGTPVSSDAIYYCSQGQVGAYCARSDDGGITFGPGVPIYTLLDCGGLHGHVKVAADGTVYVPNRNCAGQQAMAVSKDNGITWTLKTAPNSHEGVWDPSVGIGADGTVYFGYDDAGTTPRIAVYNPATDQWLSDQKVGGATAFSGVSFPEVVAGDSDRAAFAFLATTTPGVPFGSGTGFTGLWHLYVAVTYDRGATYTFTDVTPNDPVQRGNMCDGGSGCPQDPAPNTRNLLDFMDLQIDAKGRLLVGYADGCITAACVQGLDVSGPSGQPDGIVNSYDNDHKALATIARQAGGKGLFRQYDAELGRVTPAAPQLLANASTTSVNLTWSTPDDGGSALTGYKVYRGLATGTMTQLASVGPDTNSYTDNTGSANYYYSVQAINANGAGGSSPRVQPAPVETACSLPGITVAVDAGDAAPNSPAVAQVDLKSVSIAEPYMNGEQKMIFTIKLASGGALPPNSQWYVIWNRPVPDANYDRDYVAMKTPLTGAPTFEYGRINLPLVYTAPQPNQGNLPTKLGNADSGSYDAVTGTIKITVTRGSLDDANNIGIGKTLTTIEARSFLGRNDSLPINQNTTSDYTADGLYVIAGNDACNLPPAAPTNLVASSPSKGVINLTWADKSNDETSFSVERSTTIDSGFAEIATVGANTPLYTDRTVARKTTYYYRVRAIRGTAKSGYSNTAAARTK
ncbi:MAG TPA: fibronectin type III domain-containing protein [Pyrinomonadaceae bacterium]|nr:fibronectin type III domain-containing protein [Pyrinomonadaceae bacterium]